jgi:hypothetical protein
MTHFTRAFGERFASATGSRAFKRLLRAVLAIAFLFTAYFFTSDSVGIARWGCMGIGGELFVPALLLFLFSACAFLLVLSVILCCCFFSSLARSSSG